MRTKKILLAVSFAVAAILVFQASEIWLADHRINSGKPEQMERGAALLPGNADAWDLLGHFYQWDFMHSDMPRAIANYQKAVQRNPLSAHYWMDLASAYEATGDDARAQQAFESAKAVYPTSAEVAFHYGNFLLREQKYPEAYNELRQAVQTDRTLLPLVISRTWRASGDVNQLLDHVLPADVDAYLQALDFFGSVHEAEPALAIWDPLLKLREFVPLSRTFPLLDELIREDRADDARRVWREALGAAGLPHMDPARDSLIWNGDFRTEFSNGGLGWRWDPTPGAAIDFDFQAGPNDSRAVRLDFTGGHNVSLSAPFEFVPVEANRGYRFQAYMRTEQITTESGLRFSITDPNHPNALNVLTDNFTGSRPWTAVEADLSTGPETHFLLVRLVRDPSRLFDNKLSGTAWIADVSLVASSAASGAATEQRSR
ncbi:MAG: tetratricopeptide repeat protein [Candidatus Acidiferrales bacterium]